MPPIPPKPASISQLLAPGAVLAVVLLMVVPMPPIVLDLLLSLDIGLAVVLLLTTIRLSLNVAATRLVLLNGADGVEAAGSVIMAFGQFVVGGNFVVGVVVFLVLV